MEDFARRHPEIIKEYESLLEDEKQRALVNEDGESAALIRKKANELYKSRRSLMEALKLYTKSVGAAANDDEQLALALGNRSAVTFELKLYELTLRDTQSALALNSLPPAIKKRLLIRRVKCFHVLGDGSSFLRAYDVVVDVCTELELPLTPAEKKSLDDLKMTLPSTNSQSSSDVVEVCSKLNSCLPSATERVEMKVSDTRGRYLQARQVLPAGSVLISELPYVSVLLPDHWATHCYHCLREVHLSPVFCRRNGCEVRYCTVQCQLSSFKSYHQHECTLLPLIVNTGIGHLAYRIVTATGLLPLLAYRETLSNQTPVQQCHKGYDAVYNLVTNSQHIQSADMFHYCKTAQLLLMCLQTSQFFPSTTGAGDPDFIFIGSLLLRHIQQLICNAHAITVVGVGEGDETAVVSQTQNRLASAIYPTASLMNHSCRPNIVLSFVGNRLIVKNTEELRAGDEVSNSYGPHCLKMEREERQKALRAQYYFDCDCEPCTAEAATITSLKSLHCIKCGGQSLLISESEAKCKQCTVSYDARQQVEKLVQAQQLMEQAKTAPPDKALAKVKKAISILSDKVAHKFSLDLLNAFDLQSQLYASTGDMQACAESLLCGVTVLEHLYPEFSVERAHEYHKLSEVLCNCHQYSKALQYASKACSIFKHQYSESHDLVRETELLCRQIEGLRM